jgi:hypothetical protein
LIVGRALVNRFKKPKFGKTRFVDLPDFLIAELKDYTTHLKKEGLKKGAGGHVDLLFVDPEEKNGQHIRPKNLYDNRIKSHKFEKRSQ